jgi:hypothetical protein
MQRSACVEAESHYSAALGLVDQLEDNGDRDRRRLELSIPRAAALRATRGFSAPETGEAFRRATILCDQCHDEELLVPALNGLYAYHLVRAEFGPAAESAERLLALAIRRGGRTQQMIAHRAVGAVCLHVGQLAKAEQHLQSAIEAYDVETDASLAHVLGTDHATTASCFLALTQYALGNAELAHRTQAFALSHAVCLNHRHSIAQALTFLCYLHAMDRQWDRLEEPADQLLEISREHRFPLMLATAEIWGALWRWHTAGDRAAPRDVLVGIQHLEQTGCAMNRPFFEALLAEIEAKNGDLSRALARLADAKRLVERTDERWFEAELLRMESAMLADQGLSGRTPALAVLERALEVARWQGAGMWERRTRQSLASLLTGNGSA